MKKQSVLIIGAGASGLMAAKELSRKYDVTILEAAGRIGGRIYSAMVHQETVEYGAEFVHGNLPLTFKLLKEAGIKAMPTSGQMYRNSNGSFEKNQDMFNGWDELLQKMKKEPEDITLADFLDKHYNRERDATFRKMVVSYAEGFDIATTSLVSMKSLYKEWNAEDDDNYRIPGGYSSLMEFLARSAACTIQLNQPVKRVNWEKDKVTAITADGAEFFAEKVIITAPVGIFRQPAGAASIHFSPPIENHFAAFSKLGFGAALKVVIKFRERFWQDDAGFIVSSEPCFPTWWSQLPINNNTLTGWCGGPNASLLSSEQDQGIIAKAIESLARIFNSSSGEIQELVQFAEVFNWQSDDFTLGAYSYETLDSASGKETLNVPLLHTLFFAGEALYSGKHPGTVEAALKSGKDVAKKVKQKK